MKHQVIIPQFFHIIGLKNGTGWKFLVLHIRVLKIFSLKKKVGVENLEADFPI